MAALLAEDRPPDVALAEPRRDRDTVGDTVTCRSESFSASRTDV